MNIHLLPVLTDNYIFVLHDPATGVSAAVDPAEAQPVIEFLGSQQLNLQFILNTHHHWDHISGNEELKVHYHCQILASSYDRRRIPVIDQTLRDGQSFRLGSALVQVLEVPGHTLGHIAYYLPEVKALFCGDTLFSMGCGRLFEGTAEQMWQSLGQIKKLPADTLIYCSHEYTESNGNFALQIDSHNQDLKVRMRQVRELRSAGQPTIPVLLETELKTNPFLRAKSCDEFAELREKRNRF